jgi:hypothetical protein
VIPLPQDAYRMFAVKASDGYKFVQDFALFLATGSQIAIPYRFNQFSLALLTQFLFLHHGNEGNIYFESADFPSVTFLMRQCGLSPTILEM